MSDEASIKRSLKIKTGVVKRLTKESDSYRKEVEELRVKADQFSSEDTATWEAKNAKNLVNESAKMLVLANTSLRTETSGLGDLVASVENDERLKGDESLGAAKQVLEAAEELLKVESKDQ